MRVSTDVQDLERQEELITSAQNADYYIAGVYREKASGVRSDRAELQRMIADLQPGETVIAERMDRISRLPLPEAERLIESIRAKGAKLAVPGVVDLDELAADTDSEVSKIVLKALQDLLLKISLQMARDDYELRRERQKQGIELAKRNRKYTGRRPDLKKHELIVALREAGRTIKETAKMADCSLATVKLVTKKAKDNQDAAQKTVETD
jgi:DNA invertase Pin-like site-specific DNA recombinase